MDLEITLKETITVRPSELQAANIQTIELSGLDRISPAMLYTIFFFKSQLKNDGENPIELERAKRALQRVLVSWYPAAGRFKFNETTGKLEIDCNNKGVTMITAVTESKLEEFGCLHEYKPCYEKLVPKLSQSSDVSENPLVLVQITSFACGGISIGLGGSHALFDGVGAFKFLASWAHVSSGKDESDLTFPNHSRDALLHAISSPNYSCPDTSAASIYEQDHVAAIQDLYRIPMQAMASDDRCWKTALSKFGQIDPQGELVLVTLSVKKVVVDAWKGMEIESGKLTRCSTFDVLCAHVWKARVMALKLHPSTNICLQFPVDSRSRLRPPLGENFTGNAFVLASVSCSVKDLLKEPLHQTIQRIQEAKDVITDEYIKLYAKALEYSSDKFFPSMRELTIITDWLRFPFHALDFGWGPRLSGAVLLATPVPETAFLMLDLEGGYLVRLGIEKKHVQNLINNFNNFDFKY